MLISIAIDPACFGSGALEIEDNRRGLEALLKAVQKNAVIVGDRVDKEEFMKVYQEQVEGLCSHRGSLFKRLWRNLLAGGTYHYSFVFAADSATSCSGQGNRLRFLAQAMEPDVVVCSTIRQVQSLQDITGNGVEVCSLADYPESTAENLREKWDGWQYLDRLSDEEADKVIGHAVRYARELQIIDRDIGRADERLRANSVGGVDYFVRQWIRESPFAARGEELSILIVTDGGKNPPDPSAMKQAVEEAFSEMMRALGANTPGARENPDVILKTRKDTGGVLQEFKTRYLYAEPFAYMIDHAFDNFGVYRRHRSKHVGIQGPDRQIRVSVLKVLELKNVEFDSLPCSS